MEITLAEVRLILENKEKELNTLINRREECKVDIYKRERNEKTGGYSEELEHEEHEFEPIELTDRINTLKKEIRKLRLISTRANIDTVVDFEVDGEKITLQEAIYLIKQYREELVILERFGEMKTTSKMIDPAASLYSRSEGSRIYEQIIRPTFDTKLFRRNTRKMERLITKLELEINKANLTTIVHVSFIEEYD